MPLYVAFRRSSNTATARPMAARCSWFAIARAVLNRRASPAARSLLAATVTIVFAAKGVPPGNSSSLRIAASQRGSSDRARSRRPRPDSLEASASPAPMIDRADIEGCANQRYGPEEVTSRDLFRCPAAHTRSASPKQCQQSAGDTANEPSAGRGAEHEDTETNQGRPASAPAPTTMRSRLGASQRKHDGPPADDARRRRGFR